MAKLTLDRDKIDKCRELAEHLLHPINKYVKLHSTHSTETAVLRLLGLNDIWEDKKNNTRTPMANLVVEKLNSKQLSSGVATWIAAAKAINPRLPISKLAIKIINGSINLNQLQETKPDAAKKALKSWVHESYKKLEFSKRTKDKKRYKGTRHHGPLRAISLSANSIDDLKDQVSKYAKKGADVIILENSSAQKKLAHLPIEDFDTENQRPFINEEVIKTIRQILDELSYEEKRYIRLAISGGGYCSPELAAIGAFKFTDYVMADPIHDILFHDLNPKKTLIDQSFTKFILSRSGQNLHTQEEYLFDILEAEKAHPQVLCSHFLNEQLSKSAELRDEQMGLTHAFAMKTDIEDSLIYEISMAELVREVFNRHPLKYTISTKNLSDNQRFNEIVQSHYHFVGMLTHQSLQVMNIPSTSKDIPLSIESGTYIAKAGYSIYDETNYNTNGKIVRKARTILDSTHEILEKMDRVGFFESLEEGNLAQQKTSKDDGLGADKIFQKSRNYYNPFME